MAGRQPQRVGNILSELFTRRGYGRVQAENEFAEAWQVAAGEELAAQTCVGRLRRGVLEVGVANSLVAQELVFCERKIIRRLREQLPQATIERLRLRVGPLQ